MSCRVLSGFAGHFASRARSHTDGAPELIHILALRIDSYTFRQNPRHTSLPRETFAIS
jgi:hypothetical protein